MSRPPFARISSAAAPQEDSVLLTQYTSIPSRANASAMLFPIPLPAPVTTAVFLFSKSSLIKYLFIPKAFLKALQLTNAKFVDVTQHTSFMTSEQDKENPKLERPKLQKFLADAGLCSRRMGESWILEEKVKN